VARNAAPARARGAVRVASQDSYEEGRPLEEGLALTLTSQTVYNTKGTRAHTHRELIREWLWEPKESSLEYI